MVLQSSSEQNSRKDRYATYHAMLDAAALGTDQSEAL